MKKLRLSSSHMWLAVFLLLAVLPLLAGLTLSLLYSLGWVGALAKGFTLGHWVSVFSEGEVFGSIAYSIGIGLLSIGAAGAIALGLVLRYPHRLSTGWPGLSRYLPLCIPPIAAGFFSFQWLGGSGWLSRLGNQIGLIDGSSGFPDLIQDRFAFGIILTHVMLALPFFLLLFGSLYERNSLDQYLTQAQALGASPRQARRKIGIPVLFRAAFPTLILYAIFVSGAYEIPLLLGRQSPQMVSVLTVRYLRHFDLERIPQAYIVALIYGIIVLAALLLTFHRLVPKREEVR